MHRAWRLGKPNIWPGSVGPCRSTVRVRLRPYLRVSPLAAERELASLGGAGGPQCRLGASVAPSPAPPSRHRPRSSGTSRADLPRLPLAAPPVAARDRRKARGQRGNRPSDLRRTTPSPCFATRSRGRTPWKPSRPCCGCRPSPDAEPRPDDNFHKVAKIRFCLILSCESWLFLADVFIVKNREPSLEDRG